MSDDVRKWNWLVIPLRGDLATNWCKDDFGPYGTLSCIGLGEFTVNRENLRFQKVYPAGYIRPLEKKAMIVHISKSDSARPYE
jgi:hypothetical protein